MGPHSPQVPEGRTRQPKAAQGARDFRSHTLPSILAMTMVRRSSKEDQPAKTMSVSQENPRDQPITGEIRARRRIDDFIAATCDSRDGPREGRKHNDNESRQTDRL